MQSPVDINHKSYFKDTWKNQLGFKPKQSIIKRIEKIGTQFKKPLPLIIEEKVLPDNNQVDQSNTDGNELTNDKSTIEKRFSKNIKKSILMNNKDSITNANNLLLRKSQ